MNVLGYSDNHLSTLFSASIRSFHAFCPTVSRSLVDSELEEDELKSESLGRVMR
jgi:hypothetical protein